METRPDAVLFDLDGTLADTAPDLAYALNRTLAHYGRSELPFEDIRPVVSHGGIALIRLGFDIGPDDAGYDERRQFLLQVYQDNICRHTVLFPGMEEVLQTMEQAGIPWGIVTNKPSWLTDPLVEAMALSARADAVISGDTCERNKPHPMPLLHACELMGVDPTHCVYVGDADRDIAAGRAAGNHTIGATYGYLLPGEDPADWGADSLVDHPLQLLPRLRLAA